MVGVSLMSNPLINDYIKKDSRGKAVAFTSVGTLAGEAFSVVGLFGITKRMNVVNAFAFVSVILIVLALPLIYFVTEPKINVKKA